MSLELTILGYNSAIPTDHSHPTAQLLKADESLYLIDCGEGTQVQLRRARAKFSRLNHIFISHMHGDHLFGLVGLISTLQLLGKVTPLQIFGPSGIEDFILNQLRHTRAHCGFDLIFNELSSTDSHLIFEDKKVEVYTIPLDHRVYCNGYLFREKPKLRKLKIEEVNKYTEIETCDYLKIKQGHDVQLENGDIIANHLLTENPPKVSSYAFCSDTRYKPDLVDIIKNVDLLYHESTFMDDLKEMAYNTGHSTALQAAQMASDAKVSKLIIGHFSNRYKEYDEILAEAQTIFPESYLPEMLKPISI